MRRRYRWMLGGAVVISVALAGAGSILAIRGIDAYRPWAEQRLAAELRVPVAIRGGLTIAPGWSPVVAMRDVVVGDTAGDDPPLIRAEHLEVRFALLPFIRSLGRELVAEHIIVQRAQAWPGRAAHSRSREIPEPSTPSMPDPPTRLKVKLRSIEISESMLHLASGSERIDVSTARASVPPDGETSRVDVKAGILGRVIEIEGTLGGLERWLSRRRAPLAVDLNMRVAETTKVRVQGTFRGDEADLVLGAAIADGGVTATQVASQGLTMAARLRAEDVSSVWSLADLEVEHGSLRIEGKGDLRAAAMPHLRLTLRLSQSAEPALDDAPSTSNSATALVAEGEIPRLLAWLDRLTAEVELVAEALRLPDGVRLTDMRSRVEIRDGTAALKEFAAGLAGGTITATGDARAAGDIVARLQARNVDLGQLLREARGGTTITGGKLALRAELTGRISDDPAIARGLDGRADVSVGRATIGNTYADRWGFLRIFGLIDRALPTDARITMNCAAGRFSIANSVASTRGLLIDLPRLALWVSGRIDLRSQTIAMRVEPHPKVAALISVVPPANISGTLRRPVVEPDMIGAAVGVVGGFLSTPGLLAEEIGDVLGGIGDLFAGTPRTSRASGGCQVSGSAPRDDRPRLRLPNPFDLLR
ncbi:MAG: AsmA family protein [Alphaproteobacteria bacterium]|nr:AsmA family protein [Alphaproteobacteria bacterium]